MCSNLISNVEQGMTNFEIWYSRFDIRYSNYRWNFIDLATL